MPGSEIWQLAEFKEWRKDMNEMIKTIKEIHPKDICIFKIGTFYHTYNRDSYIISYLFNYKIKELGSNHKECGFPTVALSKVMAKLEQNKINYIVIDRKNNYDIDSKEDYKNLNKYDKFYEKAKKEINLKIRIENIMQYLYDNIEKEEFTKILGKMEEIMYEGRKV